MATAGGVTTFDVSEPLDWTFANPRVYLRYQDGKASRLFEASPTVTTIRYPSRINLSLPIS
jgi:hypothetical protein